MDVDEEDLPSALLDPILDEGAQVVADAAPRWPHLRTSWNLVYGADSLGGVVVPEPAVGELLVVRVEDGPALTFVDHDSALRMDWSGTTSHWSFVSGHLHLWPRPTTDTVVLLDGYRSMNRPWTAGGAGATPDLPEDFHDLVRIYGLVGAYLQQDDPETASVWQGKFDNSLASKLDAALRSPAAPPIVLNGARRVPMGVPRPTYVWSNTDV